jgi:hypothetical protein
MNPYTIEPFLIWFDRFVDRFSMPNPEDQVNIEIKRSHSKNVLSLAKDILDHLDVEPNLSFFTCLAALFHDAGRFPQYARYRTFNDRRSVNHGRLGARTLAAEKTLAGLSVGERKIVLSAVNYHNRPTIPKNIRGPSRFAVQVVRDADKIDIMRVLLQSFKPGHTNNDVVHLHLNPDPRGFSAEVLHRVISGQVIDYGTMIYINDFKLLLLSWLNAFNFTGSYKILDKCRYVDELLDCLPPLEAFEALRRSINELMQTKIEADSPGTRGPTDQSPVAGTADKP